MANAKEKTIRTYPTDYGFFDTTLPHELGHIILREFVGYKADLPTWFREGFAMYQEQAKRWQADRTVKKAMDQGIFIPLPKLNKIRLTNNMSQGAVKLYYAESASVVRYMVKKMGEFRFSLFCRNLQKGRSFKSTLKSAYPRFKNLEALNSAWVKELKR